MAFLWLLQADIRHQDRSVRREGRAGMLKKEEKSSFFQLREAEIWKL
jgi:hypothetical protein